MPRRTSPYLQQATLRPGVAPDPDTYPFNIPAIRQLEQIRFHANVTFLAGENGAGKSTLLEALALGLGLGAEGGTRNVRVTTADTVSPLHASLRLIRGVPRPSDSYFLRAESFYNVASYMDETGYLQGYGNRSLHQQSHGESFMAVLLHKLRGNGIYLLDEPEAALSPTRQLAALRAIHHLVEDGSQFIIATHSPMLLAYPHARIVLLDEFGVREVKVEETDHFVVTRDFLNHHRARMEELLDDPPQ